MKIKLIVNTPIKSNCYVIYRNLGESCIIVDPGSLDCKELLHFLQANFLRPDYILLTHEHYDHIWGVNKLKELYHSKVICSSKCDAQIIDRKKNMSLFQDEIGFVCDHADLLIEDIKYQMFFESNVISFIPTEGHSQGSICILIGNILFSGDTIIKDHNTILRFPTSSKEEFKKSIMKISDSVRYPCTVMPGHGESFIVENRAQMAALGG